jgi:hypothetical protein
LGSRLGRFSATVTLQYKIRRGLVGRLEYRHDEADEPVFSGGTSLHYSFF